MHLTALAVFKASYARFAMEMAQRIFIRINRRIK